MLHVATGEASASLGWADMTGHLLVSSPLTSHVVPLKGQPSPVPCSLACSLSSLPSQLTLAHWARQVVRNRFEETLNITFISMKNVSFNTAL